jgi:putative two-component system response regulator
MTKKTILVVDDTPENIDLLVGLLKDTFIVKAARSGQVALKIAGQPKPLDAILLDVVMPGMNGFEVCSELKASAATSAIPVIFLSGESGAEERKRAEEVGGTAYLTKPVDPEKLMAAIQTALSTS